ncbi:MAG: type III secretion system export apparatus subunit SctT [Verrucomicrobiota bacterium]
MDLEPFKTLILTVGLCVVRLLTVFMIVPIFSEGTIPGTIRRGLVLSIVLIIYPMVAPTLPEESIPLIDLVALLVKEIIIGVFLGFFFSIPFRIAEGVGYLIDNQRGTGMASVFDPMAGGEVTPMGVLMLRMIIILFIASGGLLLFFKAVLTSYQVYPVFSLVPDFNPGMPVVMLGLLDKVMAAILILGAPILIAVFTSEFGLGLVNRFAPQLNVFFLAMPIKSAVALLMMVLFLPYLFDYYMEEFSSGDQKVFAFLRTVLEPVE